MDKIKQRIAIAEACGWQKPGTWGHSLPESKTLWGCEYGGIAENPPDYLDDLNAMHQAERILTDEQRKIYTAYLHPKQLHHYLEADFLVAHSTAAQRAEAFLKTIGKWEK